MNQSKKEASPYELLLRKKLAAQAGRQKYGILGQDLAQSFGAGEKAQPKPGRGGRNGSGKP